MIVGTQPRKVENELVDEGFVGERLLARLLSSRVIANPAMVTVSAVVFQYQWCGYDLDCCRWDVIWDEESCDITSQGQAFDWVNQ